MLFVVILSAVKYNGARTCSISIRKPIEKIRHEVNTLYSKYKDKALIIHKSIGVDDCYYNYYIENYGYDDIRIVARIPNND